MRETQLGYNYEELLPFLRSLPDAFERGEGKVIYKGRNELREFYYMGAFYVVKSFAIPNLINQIIYGKFRPSKAERSYKYGAAFTKSGIGTPMPVGFWTERIHGFFRRSFFVTEKSQCPYTFRDFKTRSFPREQEILEKIAKVAARMHDLGCYHKDYSAGNILFRDDLPEIQVEIIDLNRMSFGKIDVERGCKNFERLSCPDRMLRVMANAYAAARGFDPDVCFRLMRHHMDLENKRRGNV